MKTNKVSDYVKANRKGSRETELENKTGWTALEKKHKTIKDYNRKDKYKISPNNLSDENDI